MNEKTRTGVTGTICCVPGCQKNTKHNRNVSWHLFPTDPKTRKEWIRRVNRVGASGKFSTWCPTKYSKICGKHFNESGRKKYEEKLPSLFPHKTYPTRYFTNNLPKKAVTVEDTFNRCLYPMQFNEESPRYTSHFTRDFEVGANVVIQHAAASNTEKFHHINPGSTDVSEKISDSTDASLHGTCHNYALPISTTLPKMKKLLDTVVAQNLAFEEENKSLKSEVKRLIEQLLNSEEERQRLEADIIVLKSQPPIAKNVFSLQSIINDDVKIRFYTGFQNKVRLDIFLNFILGIHNNSKKKSSVGRPKALVVRDELFVVLCRLRLGLLEKDLAHRFEVSVGTISRIWNYWIPFLCSCLVQVPIWPSRQTVDNFMPKEFQEMYPTTRIILDCTELFIENPTEFRVQSDTYSSYKSHNTAKGLIGVTPNGFVSLVSDLAPGRVSDKVVTNESGLYAKLESGDSVMADRGFLIEDKLKEISVGLNIPPFLKGRPQLSPEDEKLTRNIAKLRIHVERVIRGVKQFRILKYVFPNSMADKLDPIWKICCLLINFTNEPLLDRQDQQVGAVV